jgi:carboxypeptidase D
MKVMLFVSSIFFGYATTATAFKASDFLVKGLEKIEPAFAEFDGRMHAGLLPTDRDAKGVDQGNLMFWLFEPDEAVAPDTLTIWLNGGPGCSSLASGNLFENGPVTTPHYPAGYPKTRADDPLVVNEWGWTKATNMMFVEAPVGTGFSSSSGPPPETEADVSANFYEFLEHFFDTFPEMRKKKLFLFGESYAGYYVPSIAHKIHTENKAEKRRKMNLEGIGLGNGWMDAKVQGPVVIDYAWWHGMIDSTTRDALHAVWENCKAGVPMRQDRVLSLKARSGHRTHTT